MTVLIADRQRHPFPLAFFQHGMVGLCLVGKLHGIVEQEFQNTDSGTAMGLEPSVRPLPQLQAKRHMLCLLYARSLHSLSGNVLG